MAQNHEDAAVELHSTLQQREGGASIGGTTGGRAGSVDMTGAKLPVIEHEKQAVADLEHHHDQTPDEAEPTEHEKKTLRHIGDKFPASAYLIAGVELCERFTCMSFLCRDRACLLKRDQTMDAKVCSRTTSTTDPEAKMDNEVLDWVMLEPLD